MSADNTSRPPLPPFTRETAAQKVRMAEDGWNSRDPERVSLAYMQELHDVRSSVQKFGAIAPCAVDGIASINDLPIKASERKYRWPLGRRPDDHPGLTQLGL